MKRAGRIVFRGRVDEESGVDASDSWDGAAEVMVARLCHRCVKELSAVKWRPAR